VFGELAQLAIPRATHLIFLDKSCEGCVEALLERGYLGNLENHIDKSSLSAEALAELERSFQALVQWAREYYQRTDLRSQIGHQNIFQAFEGIKSKLTDRSSVAAFLETFVL
jgi:hypothetical protein